MIKVNHDLRCVDGKTIYMPAWKGGQAGWGNLTMPDVREVDITQQYPVGTKLVDSERVFYYAKSLGITNTDMGVKNGYTQHIAFTTIAAVAVAGTTKVVIDVAATDGVLANGAIAEDELAGGYVVIFPHATNSFTSRIVSNTATTGAGEMTLALGDELPVAIDVDTDHGECMANPFLGVKNAADSTSSVMGMARMIAASGKWLWLQTWGPIWIAPQAEVSVGNNDRQVVFRHDGSVDEYDYSDLNVTKAQHAGFVLANASGGGQGAAFIMLQICP